MIHIGRDDEKTDTLLKFLHLVFMSRLTEAEREARLKKDFGIELWDETREGLSDMCNLSQGLKEDTREEEKQDTILRLLKDGRGTDIMAESAEAAESVQPGETEPASTDDEPKGE